MKNKIIIGIVMILLVMTLSINDSYAFSFKEWFSNLFKPEPVQKPKVEQKIEQEKYIQKKEVEKEVVIQEFKPLKEVEITQYSNYVKLTNINAYSYIASSSNSMYPTFKADDIILEERYNGQELKKGMIICFEKNGKYVVHRIASLRYINGKLTQIETRGDNLYYSEYVDYPEDVKCIVRGIIYKY